MSWFCLTPSILARSLMREVAAAGEAVQPKATSAASAVRKVPLILLPKRPDGAIDASCVPRRCGKQVIEIKTLFFWTRAVYGDFGQHPLPVSVNSCRCILRPINHN